MLREWERNSEKGRGENGREKGLFRIQHNALFNPTSRRGGAFKIYIRRMNKVGSESVGGDDDKSRDCGGSESGRLNVAAGRTYEETRGKNC